MHTPAPLGGFKIGLDTCESFLSGCLSPAWQDSFEFAANKSITSIEIYYDDWYVHGLRLYTNGGNIIEGLGNAAGNGIDHCVIERGDLAAIETRAGAWIDTIRLRFHDC